MTFDNLQKAIVDEEIRPNQPGRVRFQNSWWPAKCEETRTFKVGDTVHVVAIENITLIVVEASC
ncbi:MAG: hypothetical protein HC786_14910 [Richelia sp. CSU_2_1]|nr:hypothetical protein [Microcoleus sp. SU_5_6]NJL69476.1 hypothetical protein [Microcoleus sp. SM1_3_4]NJR23351.1 hypothetical protein [Richelia sp. CSU_2_1]